MEVESTDQSDRTATGSGHNDNGNEAVAGATSQAFARWTACTIDMPRQTAIGDEHKLKFHGSSFLVYSILV